MRRHLFITLSVVTSLASGAAIAQSSGIPAEFPPAEYAGNQYVDSNGCAFIRAGISGITNWVPRVDRSRSQVCNFEPTFPVADAAPEPAVEAPAVAMAPAAAPAAPASTGSLVLSPTAADLQRPAPRIASAPAPAAVAAPAAPRMTLAEACDGKFGVQAGFISSSTGEPIDCGPAPVATATVAAPEPAVAEVPRMTLAQICDGMSTGNIRYIDANTGEPIVCPSAPAAVATVAAPASTGPRELTFDEGIMGAACNLAPTNGGKRVECQPNVQQSRATISTMGASVPASNPTGLLAVPQPPEGYAAVWDDGRLNPNRGLQTQRAFAAAPRTTLSKPFIQVGSFGVHGNADQLVAQLRSMGIPAQTSLRGSLKLVAAGPFETSAVQNQALSRIQSLGFRDAYFKN